MLAKALDLDANVVIEDRPGEYLIRAVATPARIADLACFLRDRDATLTALRSGQRTLEAVFLQITMEPEASPPVPVATRRRGRS
jgi:hypothetical protein